jgi:cytochrome c553
MKRLLSVLAAAGLLSCAGVQAADVKGDAHAGEKKVAMCLGCHNIIGYQASFPEVHKVPMIAGQNAAYIVAALTEYKKGERKHPTMRAIAGSLSEQDIADVAAFYEQQGKGEAAPKTASQPAPEVAALLAKGACASCHGANFSMPIDGSYPKLAGQHPDYLFVALKAYQTQENPQVGRGNPVMSAQVKQFNHAELKAIAQYISSLPSELKTVPESRFR